MKEGNLCDENPSHSLDKQQTQEDIEVGLTNEEARSKQLLTLDVKQDLTGERKHACNKCTKVFKRKAHLVQHELIHDGEYIFACGQCKKAFKRKDCLQQHELTHSSERLFACNQCDKKFGTPSARYSHQRYHSGSYPCSECTKIFKKKYDFTKTRTGSFWRTSVRM